MTDERDPKVSQRYRELPGEEPSRELDQTIVAAAHRSVDKPHAPLVVPAGRHRWYYSLAAAAIVVLAVAVTVQVERQQPDAELVPPPPAPAPALQQERPVVTPELKRESRAREERRQPYAPDPLPAPAAPTPPPAPAAEPRADAAAEASKEQAAHLAQERQAAEKAAAQADMARAPAAAASRAAASAAVDSPERELQRIAELRAAGRDEEADKALAEFRKRYPDYQISQAMRSKVERRPAR